MSAVGRFNGQLSHPSKIPFESLLSPGETHVTSFGSEQVHIQVLQKYKGARACACRYAVVIPSRKIYLCCEPNVSWTYSITMSFKVILLCGIFLQFDS